MRFFAEWKQQPPCFASSAHIAFSSSRLPISCHIPFPHGFHLNTFVSQQLHVMYVCQSPWTDLLTLTRTSCRSLEARGLVDLINSHATHPGVRPCLSMCNHSHEEDALSLHIDCLSICSISRVSSCPLYTCLIVKQTMRIHRPSSSTWFQVRGAPTSRTTRYRMNGTRGLLSRFHYIRVCGAGKLDSYAHQPFHSSRASIWAYHVMQTHCTCRPRHPR